MVRQINKTHRKLKLKRYIGIALLSMTLLFLWQLYRAPIALPFLKPYIIKALNHDDADFEVSLNSVNLELVRSIKPIKIVANNVEYKNKAKTFIINAPKVSVSFSMKAMLHGIIAPSGIEILSPKIYVFKTEKKTPDTKQKPLLLREEQIKDYLAAFSIFMERFNSADNIYSESYINNIEIFQASVEVHDIKNGQSYNFSDLNYSFNRGFRDIKMSFTSFLTKNKSTTPFGFDIEYRPSTNKLALQTYLTEFVPAKILGNLFGANINIPLSGRIQTLIDLNQIMDNKQDFIAGLEKSVSKIIFDFEGSKGSVTFDGLKDYSYDLSAILLKGEIQGKLDKLEIKNAMFDIEDQKLAVNFSATGIKTLLLDNSYKDVKLSVSTITNKLPFDKLTNFWPKYIAPVAWQWCRESITNGLANDVNFTFNFAYDENKKNIAFESLQGKVDVFDADVDYLTGMPKINNVYGVASFNNDEIKIDIQKGVTEGISINEGFVRLYDLATDSAIEVSLVAHSSITNAIKLISNPPINYGQDINISPEDIKGYGDINLHLQFLLTKEVLLEDINLNLKAQLSDVFVPQIIKGFNFASNSLDLELTTKGFRVYGPSFIDDISVDLLWTEGFSKEDVTSYQLGFDLLPKVKEKLGFDLSILKEPYLMGTPKAIANIKVKDNKTTLDVAADLENSYLDFSFLGILKEANIPATITAQINLDGDNINTIKNLTYNQEGLFLQSDIIFDNQNRPTEINIPKITGDKTNANASVLIDYKTPSLPAYKINVSGDSYNLTKLFNKQTTKNQAQTTQKEKSLEETNDAQINISVNSLWTINDFPINDFNGSAIMKNGIGIDELTLVGSFNKEKNTGIMVNYAKKANSDEYFLDIASQDAGATLNVLGIYEHMEDGHLQIQAKKGADKKLIGHAKIRDANIHNTPVMAKLLTVASLSGLLNMLTGDGIEFSHIDIPFEYFNKILKTKNAKASGNVMVITANGEYNQILKTINIKGVVAPLRGLDNLIGSIPLLGDLLTGEDGTVFAANYEILGTVNKPDVNINPFSALSPSSLKDLVGVSVYE